MDSNSIKPVHVFTLLLIFLVIWVYTEVTEKWEREAFNTEVEDFMTEGDRFTGEQGKALEARIEALEAAQ